MTDWATVSSLATAGGTLVLAVATFASVRSANRSTRLSELAFQEQLRPALVHSRLDDPVQRIMFGDDHWVQTEGGGATVELLDGVVYMTLSLRNVGAGIAVLQAWHPWPERMSVADHQPVDRFRPQARDFYVPPGGTGLWQGALRDRGEVVYGPVAESAAARRGFSLDLLYSDSTGAQRTISRFLITPTTDGQGWTGEVTRNWHLDRVGPR